MTFPFRVFRYRSKTVLAIKSSPLVTYSTYDRPSCKVNKKWSTLKAGSQTFRSPFFLHLTKATRLTQSHTTHVRRTAAESLDDENAFIDQSLMFILIGVFTIHDRCFMKKSVEQC
jgi:hypothetical protein